MELRRALRALDREVRPLYGDRSLVDVARDLRRALVGEEPRLLESVSPDRIMVLIIDSLGLNLLARGYLRSLANEADYVSWATSVAPSTTAAALASLFTGEPPARHGILGYKMFIKELGAVIKTLSFSPAVGGVVEGLREAGVEVRLNHAPTIFESVTPLGVKCFCFTSHANSTYTAQVARGAKLVEARGLSELLHLSLTALKKGARALVYAYWAALDHASHEYGPFSRPVRYLLAGLESTLLEFLRDFRAVKDSTLIVLADHGQLSVRGGERVNLYEAPGLLEALSIPPFGEARFTYLKAANSEALEAVYREALAGHAQLLSLEEYAPLLGAEERDDVERLGRVASHVLVARGRAMLIYPYRGEDLSSELKGHHGGLSGHEMLVPILVFTS
ncbi:MAG: hypothetical protein DRK00_01360 [Thermoprotei archaeon]|nr:MAG: hypothetical protein DRK00_01360 [Thermoprotei archaeon]